VNSSTAIWSPTVPLPEGRTLLIEASAGTGKTWQMASLVARLVAEADLPVHEILVITFTNAAAAELRDRVRRRLAEARAALERDTPPEGEDPVLRHLWAATDRAARAGRLAAALSDFDRAPISTIHGFSQRTLDQLAFESGQEPGLELLADPAEIVSQLVDDELARACARATEEQLVALSGVGYDRAGLTRLAKEMTQAVAPEPLPAVSADDARSGDPLAVLADWATAVAEFAAWWRGPEGAAALSGAFERAYGRKDIHGSKLQRKKVEEAVAAVAEWLARGAPRAERGKDGWAELALKYLDADKLRNAWQRDEAALDATGILPICARFRTLVDRQDALDGRLRAEFAARVRPTLERELRRRGLLTYDTMLSRLAERIQAPGEGPDGPLAAAIRGRFRAALVDEFQDTDAAQWAVLKAVFAHPERRLFVVGDPKQAIYAFRGADVHVYLDAARDAARWTMTTNWRSDEPFVRALNAFWRAGSGAFDLPDVDYVEVAAQPKHHAWRLRGLPPVPTTGDGDGAARPRRPFELRWLDGSTVGAETEAIGNKADGEAAAAAACAREAARLLGGGVELCAREGGPDEDVLGWRPLRPGDVAVLVRTNAQGERVRRALAAWGIPSVSGGRGSVYQSPVALWLVAFLDALAEPGRDAPARALVTTPLFGWTARQLAEALVAAQVPERPPTPALSSGGAEGGAVGGAADGGAPDWGAWIATVVRWSERWPRVGFIRVIEQALDERGVLARLLGAPDGERLATDLRHLSELCHAEERRARLGPGALAAWLRDRVADAGQPGHQPGDEAALRLESDARAVQVVTVHKSKGLEYPVVLLPFGWAASTPGDDGQPIRFHAPAPSDAAPGAGAPSESARTARSAGHPDVGGGGGRWMPRSGRVLPGSAERCPLGTDSGSRAPEDAAAGSGDWTGRPPHGAGADAAPSGPRPCDGERTRLLLDLHPKGAAARAPALAAAAAEARQEDLRLLYVALTRAAHHAVAWLGPIGRDGAKEPTRSALGWLALRPPTGGGPAAGGACEPGEARERLAALVDGSGGHIGWSPEAPLGPPAPIRLALPGGGRPRARTWDGRSTLGSAWMVASFSSLVAGRTFEEDERVRADEALLTAALTAPDEGLAGPSADLRGAPAEPPSEGDADAPGVDLLAPAVLAHLASGTDVGTWVHAVLEHLDFVRGLPRDGQPLARLVADTGRRVGVHDPLQHALLEGALPRMLRTPLDGGPGGLPAGFCLAELTTAARLDELPFDLRLGGGSAYRCGRQGSARIDPQAVHAALSPRGDGWPGAAWLQHVLARGEDGSGAFPAIAGILTGFVDLVFRVPAEGDGWRYFVADYKTNRIVPPSARAETRRCHYTQPWLAWTMGHGGYHLQALLYTLALHRLLRARLGPAYDYDRHVGGHLYLFLRGMEGAHAVRDGGLSLGVWHDRWPREVVLGLDAALDGASPEEVVRARQGAAPEGAAA
jgi:exodeoxyribonuclease V beta subunit